MIRLFTRQIEKLHSEDGQALVFVALVGLVSFRCFALTRNVAELVTTKIQNPNAWPKTQSVEKPFCSPLPLAPVFGVTLVAAQEEQIAPELAPGLADRLPGHGELTAPWPLAWLTPQSLPWPGHTPRPAVVEAALTYPHSTRSTPRRRPGSTPTRPHAES